MTAPVSARHAALARNHPAYWAFVAHRVSGLALALFLPAHFYVLGLALDAEAFGSAIAWTADPLVKLMETLLVGGLAVHLAGGLRLLALEFLPWSQAQKTRIALAFGFGLAVALAFAFQALRG